MIKLTNVTKTYVTNKVETKALKGVNLEIKNGEMLAIMGASGSGKSTLLNILGCMDNLTSGRYLFDEVDIGKLKTKELGKFRKDNVSFVFQSFALMNNYTVFENVEMPLLARRIGKKDRKKAVNKALKILEIEELKEKYPLQISGGQQQRVAIARAIVTDSSIILADEPTGALDIQNSMNLMRILKNINNEGKTVVIVTHDESIAAQCTRTVRISDGRIL